MKSTFKRVINWNKYSSKPEIFISTGLNHLVEPRFQKINGIFILAYEGDTPRTTFKSYYLPNVEIKDYNIMSNGENSFDQPIKNNKVTYEIISKICTGSGADYTTGLFLRFLA